MHSVEQTGFRPTVDYIHTLRQVIGKGHQLNQSLYLGFIDFEKVFDSVEIWLVIIAMERCRSDYRYVQIIKNLYENANHAVEVFEETNPINVRRALRQGDTLSSELIRDFQNFPTERIKHKH